MITFPQGIESLVPMGVLFLLIATRLGGLFLIAPIFGSRTVSAKVRLVLVVTISMAIMFSHPGSGPKDTDVVSVIIALLGEAAVGLAAGLSARMILASVETAGQLLSTPMGMGFANAADPLSGINQAVTSRFLSLIATISFLALNMHHMLLSMMAQSFQVLPPGYALPSLVSSQLILKNAAFIFDGAVRLAAPVMIVLLGVMATIGLLARVAPKMNMLVLSFAVSVGLGLVTLHSVLPDMVAWIRGVILRIEPVTLEVLNGFVQG